MKNTLNNQIAIVTGASRGIGRGIAKMLLEKGAQVYGIYKERDDKAEEFEELYKSIKMLKVNVACEYLLQEAIEEIGAKHKRIDILINNAGINKWEHIENYPSYEWNQMIAVNVSGKFYAIKYAIPFLEKSKNPIIINLSSRLSYDEYLEKQFICYSVTNAAINTLTKGLALELEDENIRVNAIIPTVTDTDRFKHAFTEEEKKQIINKGKLGTPNEVAQLAQELIEDPEANGKILVDERVYI